MTARAIWRSEQPSYEQPIWSSQRPSEPPTLTLDAFEQDAGFAALAWTRATARCITDWQGNVHEIPASAKPRNGVRVVRNLAQVSENLGGTGWSGGGYTVSTAKLLLATAATSTHYLVHSFAATRKVGERIIFSFDLEKYSDTWIQVGGANPAFGSAVWVNINLDTGAIGNSGVSGTYTVEACPDNSGAWRVHVAATIASVADLYCCFVALIGDTNTASRLPTVAATAANGVYVDHLQIESGRPGQTTTGGKVSVGVLATPYHDGIGVAGLRYFNTDENGALITGMRGYDRDETGAWVVSSDVDPIVPSIPVGVAQTNRVTYPSDLSNAAWTKLGSATATAGYDAQIGTYTRVAGLAAAGANDVSITASGFTNDSRIEVALLLRAVTTSGLFRVRHPSSTANGSWDIDLAQVSTTRFERIDRFHPAVTINTEFTATAAGAGGVLLARGDSGSGYSVDVARVAQVQGERVHEIPVEATAVSTINADAPSFTALPTYATNNEGTFVFDFTPKAQTSLQANYLSGVYLCYKNTANDRLFQDDGTVTPNFGDQVEGTRTKIATSWETVVGRYGYRDGVSTFAATAYDGAWGASTATLVGPMLLHRMLMHRSAESTAYLQGVTA